MLMAGVVVAVPALRRVTLARALRHPGDSSTPIPEGLTLARFMPYVGRRFTLGTGGTWVRLEEAAATAPRRADRPGLKGESFSLIFRAEGPAMFRDGMYKLVHPALGSTPLFLVAVGTGVGGQGYQAVVDRRVPAR